MINMTEFCKGTVFKLLVVAVFSCTMYLLAGFMLPLFLAVGLAFILAPIVRQFEKLTVGHGLIPLTRGVAIFLSFVVFGIFLALVVMVIAPPLLDQMNALLQQLPELAARAHVADWRAVLRGDVYPTLPSNLNSLAESFIGWLMGLIGMMVRGLISSSMGILANLVGLIVVPFLSFYFLKDWRSLCDMFVALFRPEVRPKVEQILQHLGRTLGDYVHGLGKLCLVSGLVIFAGTMLLGLKYSLVFAVVAILAETIPVFGPVVGATAAIFTAYASNVNLAVFTAIFYGLYYLADANILMPKIMGATVDLPAVVLLIALMIGGKLFGILGMLFAVPVAAVYRVLYKELWHMDQ